MEQYQRKKKKVNLVKKKKIKSREVLENLRQRKKKLKQKVRMNLQLKRQIKFNPMI